MRKKERNLSPWRYYLKIGNIYSTFLNTNANFKESNVTLSIMAILCKYLRESQSIFLIYASFMC